jgi:methionine sulfoxide reductase heme-binding subunit
LTVVALIHSYRLLAAILALPWAILVFGYGSGRLFYGELIHASGDWSIWILMLALAVTPLRRVFPRRRWTAWLVPRRRYFGVASFAYALLHVAVYVVRQGDGPKILAQALEAGILTGWLAFALFIPLALTSNGASVKRLGRTWKALHRIVYAAAALAFAHWILVAFDPTAAFGYLAVLVAVELSRFIGVARAE